MGAIPPKRPVMKGQQAAMYGLLLAGTPFAVSCEIVGSNRETMSPYIQADWRKMNVGRRVTKWTGEAVEEARELYCSGLPLKQIAELLDTNVSVIDCLARRNDWPRRRWFAPKPIKKLPPAQRSMYRKMRPIVGKNRAFIAAMKVAA